MALQREWRVWSFGHKAVVVRHSGPGERAQFVSETQIQRWFDESPQVVRSMLEALPGPRLSWSNREELLLARRRLKEAFEYGQLVLTGTKEVAGTGGGAEEGEPAPPSPASKKPSPAPAAAPSSPTAVEKTYFACQLLDEDGNPMPDEAYKLTITDGSARTGNLDADGCVYVPKIDPGECSISFPEIRLNPRKKKPKK